jgi:hypothetical protein
MSICHTCQQTYSNEFEICPADGAHLTAQATETEAQLPARLPRCLRIVHCLGAMGTIFLAEQIAVGNPARISNGTALDLAKSTAARARFEDI